ncbi:MAG: nickel-dependent lactate racemase [Alphaproteobacteria bacterium]
MSPPQISLPFGAQPLQFDLPAGWNLAATCEPAPYDALDDPAAACAAALAEPIGAPPLAELAKGKSKIAIVLEDIARPTPVHLFSEAVAAALAAAGVPDEAVTVVTALGVHRAMTEAEIEAKIGPAVYQRYRAINHDFENNEQLAHLGCTQRGTEVWINRAVAEAELVIALGCVEPHIIASFGGGAKAIIPGVAGKDTIAANHAVNTKPQTFNNVGLDPNANPMRQDLEEGTAMLKAPVFAINAVLRGDLSIARMVAGDPVQAHRAGCETAAQIFGAKIPHRADVVIAGSHPMNIDFRQGAKALANTVRALKPGGTMLCMMACEQGIGDMPLPEKGIPLGKRGMKFLSTLLLPLVGRTTFGMKEEDHFFIYFTLQTVKNYNTIIYSPNLPPELERKLRFLGIETDLDAALAAAKKAVPRGDALVFPKGGITYPIIS